MTIKYYVVAACNELAVTMQMYVELNGEEILLCREGEDYFAVSYYCSHERFTLEGGTIAAGCITCPYHGAEFRLSDGEVIAPPAFEPIKTYPIRVEDDTIAVGINE